MRLERLVRRLTGVGAKRMTIRRHVPWPVRLGSIVLAVGLGAVLAIALWQWLFGNAGTIQAEQRQEIQRLTEALNTVSEEKQRLEAIGNSASSQIKVEQTASDRLATQIKALEEDNARLKSDIAYFESLFPSSTSGETGVSIRRFEVSSDSAPNQIRYRAFFMQGGRSDREFSGTLQFVVSTVSAGRPGVWTWPDQAVGDARDRGKLVFKRHQRIEGSLDLPPGSSARSVQIRVLEKGVVRAQQSVTL